MKLQSSIGLLGAAVASVNAAVIPDRPFVDSKGLQDLINREELLEHAKALEDIAYSTPGRNRVFGSPGHDKTVEYIVQQLDPEYYDIALQQFDHIFFEGNTTFAANDQPFESNIMTYSSSGEVKAPIVVVNNLGCDAADFPPEVKGNIALILRGTCPFAQKVGLAGKAGAAAAIVYNNQPGVVAGTLGDPRTEGPFVPSAGISGENGTFIVESIKAGTAFVGHVKVDSVQEIRVTNNVIATTKTGDQNNILMVGAHSDSVAAGPGINDNGSGSVGLLTAARALTQYSVTNAVRFAWFSAEEFGLIGSEYYVKQLTPEENLKIRLYENFDMIASPNYIVGIYDGDGSAFNLTGPAGSAQNEKFFEEHFKSQGQASVPTAFSGRSDYGPFLAVNIPAGGLFTGADGVKTEEEVAMFGGTAGITYDENYHLVGDTVANLDVDVFEVNAKAIAASIAYYASDWRDFPTRELKKPEEAGFLAPVVQEPVSMLGFHDHCMTPSA